MNRYVKTYTVYYTLKEGKERFAETFHNLTQAKARVRKLEGKTLSEDYLSDPMIGSSIEIINLG